MIVTDHLVSAVQLNLRYRRKRNKKCKNEFDWKPKRKEITVVLSMSSGLTDPVISGSWSVDMNCITSGSGGRWDNINVLDCCHYCESCSIQELFECEWDACRSVGWRLQASWRLRARRIDDAVQSPPTAASLFTICLVDAAFLNIHRTNYHPYLWLCCFVIF